MNRKLLSATLLLLAACGTSTNRPDYAAPSDIDSSDLRPNGIHRIIEPISQNPLGGRGDANRGSHRGNGISYHGGAVLTGGPNVHYIWYGTWASGDQAILTNLAESMGGSPYFNINTTYTNAAGTHVANKVTYSGAASDNYSRGKALADADIEAIVAAQNPTDTNGVYFVLTSPDVTESSGFCTQYCGWHTNATINGRDIKYAFVGNPVQCPTSCSDFGSGVNPPNGSVGADGMASIISHELEESTTDPDLNAWYDSQGNENADKCAWTFGSVSSNSAGDTWNMTLGGKNYLIQQNWVNASGGYCAKSY